MGLREDLLHAVELHGSDEVALFRYVWMECMTQERAKDAFARRPTTDVRSLSEQDVIAKMSPEERAALLRRITELEGKL